MTNLEERYEAPEEVQAAAGEDREAEWEVEPVEAARRPREECRACCATPRLFNRRGSVTFGT